MNKDIFVQDLYIRHEKRRKHPDAVQGIFLWIADILKMNKYIFFQTLWKKYMVITHFGIFLSFLLTLCVLNILKWRPSVSMVTYIIEKYVCEVRLNNER